MNQTEKDYLANKDAKFLPYGPGGALPCIEIGGVQVYAYVRDGQLRVSIDYDTADTSEDSPFKVYGEGFIPTVTSVNGITVWEVPELSRSPRCYDDRKRNGKKERSCQTRRWAGWPRTW